MATANDLNFTEQTFNSSVRILQMQGECDSMAVLYPVQLQNEGLVIKKEDPQQ
jgi:hypothetical protein